MAYIDTRWWLRVSFATAGMASLALWAGDLAAQEPPADASVKAADISKRIQSPAKPAPLVAEPEQIADCHRKLDDLIGAQRNPEYKEPIAESFKEIEVEIPKLAERFVALEEDPSIPGDIGEDVRATCQARIPGFGPAYDLASKKAEEKFRRFVISTPERIDSLKKEEVRSPSSDATSGERKMSQIEVKGRQGEVSGVGPGSIIETLHFPDANQPVPPTLIDAR